jgi:hypothetical protein
MADSMNFINELLEKFKFKIMLFIYLFIVTLYLKTVSVTQAIYGWMRLNGDSKRIWKELATGCF